MLSVSCLFELLFVGQRALFHDLIVLSDHFFDFFDFAFLGSFFGRCVYEAIYVEAELTEDVEVDASSFCGLK